MTTASDVRESVEAWVADAIESGELPRDDSNRVDEWIHESADGCEFVIYYRHSRGLFDDGALEEWLDEARQFGGPGGFESVDEWLTAATYLFVKDELEIAVRDALESAE